MAFSAAYQQDMMVLCCCDIGSTDMLFVCSLFWQEANKQCLNVLCLIIFEF